MSKLTILIEIQDKHFEMYYLNFKNLSFSPEKALARQGACNFLHHLSSRRFFAFSFQVDIINLMGSLVQRLCHIIMVTLWMLKIISYSRIQYSLGLSLTLKKFWVEESRRSLFNTSPCSVAQTYNYTTHLYLSFYIFRMTL